MNRKQRRAGKKGIREKKAVATAPGTGMDQGLATAIDHHQNGRLAEAEAGYRQILEATPNHADANHLLGVIAYQVGNFDVAEQLISQAVKTDPNQALYHLNLGNVLQDQQRHGDAINSYEKALAINSDFPEAHNNMGNALNSAGQAEMAISSFQEALALRPEYAEAHNNLGNILNDLEQSVEAVGHLQKALSLNPAYTEAHLNLARALFGMGKTDDALSSSRQAIALNPDFADAHLNLSVILLKQGHLDDSLAAAEKALSLAPDSPGAHTAVANVLRDFGRFDEAITHYRQAIDLKGDFEEAHSNLLMTLHYPPSTTSEDFLAAATAWARPYNDACPRPTFANKADPDKRLRVGYVSADFSKHPVGFYLERILPFHKSQAVEYVGYCNSLKVDETTERLQQSSSLWRKITNLSDAALAEQIRQDNIDILIDLSGHTAGNRLGAFALRPAPVQVTWMGYTGTTGLKAMDHILADRFVVRDGEEDLFSEQVTFLPGCYLNFDPPRLDIDTAPPPATKSGFITFGSFNNRVKITDEAIAAWSQILIDVPKSRLLLKTAQLDDDGVRQSLLDQFRSHGIDEDRLDLEGRSPREELLRAYQRIDIALDTRPFSGGVTTAEALWMGVPVVTLRSNRWSGRLGETILTGAGMAELVAESPQQYHDLAVTLAGDLPRLETLHAELRERLIASPFCDGPAFTSKLETAYREMWQTWCAEGSSTLDIKQAYALAVEHHQQGRNAEAGNIYQSILEADPNHLASLHNLALVVMGDGDPEQALALFDKALSLKPDYAGAHAGMGSALFKLGRYDDALASQKRALAINPDDPQTHFNMGTVYLKKELPQLAVASYREAVRLNPADTDSYNNMGNAYNVMGNFDEALECCRKAIELNPDNDEAWRNLTSTTKLAMLQKNLRTPEDFFDLSGLGQAIRSSRHFAMYEYALGSFRPHEADASYLIALDSMPKPSPTRQPANDTIKLPGNTVAMLHFGRSGTGLMHSLIDAHPEISTLPSLYLAGYFNNGVWEHLSQGPVEQLPERFADMFAVLFDASSLVSVPGALRDGLSQIGVQEGMTTVGDNRDEILKVDRNLFCSEARRLMAGLGNIDTGIFLRIVHAAYEHALATKTDRHTLFYHIHNPTSYTTLNFLSQMPDARFLMMVREPLQSLESWLKDPAREHDYGQIVLYILTMIYGIDRVPFRQHDSIGVRLEDLKSRPKPTMQSLCNWIGITETPSLYEMTAQGKKWWGDPTSPDYDKKKEMSPFDDTCFKRPPGTLLGDRDRLLLKTLFHPFSVRFGYAEDDPDTFSTSLSEARAILHEPLQFEQKIIEQTNADPDLFCKRGDYLMLRAALGDRLDVLDELGTYPHMLTPLTIEQDG